LFVSASLAVKVIERKKLSAKDSVAVEREVKILKDCADVDHIVRMVDFYESPTSFYVVQVYARGGDVFERLATRTSYTEKDARFLAIHLIKAIEVLHSRKMAHRDLKPENLLLSDLLDDSGILLADFGYVAELFVTISTLAAVVSPSHSLSLFHQLCLLRPRREAHDSLWYTRIRRTRSVSSGLSL
jgi:serine/threonine protein kinase